MQKSAVKAGVEILDNDDDNDNNLMGILTRGSRYIGGDSHAGIGDDEYGVSKDSPTSINLQPLGAAKSKFK